MPTRGGKRASHLEGWPSIQEVTPVTVVYVAVAGSFLPLRAPDTLTDLLRVESTDSRYGSKEVGITVWLRTTARKVEIGPMCSSPLGKPMSGTTYGVAVSPAVRVISGSPNVECHN